MKAFHLISAANLSEHRSQLYEHLAAHLGHFSPSLQNIEKKWTMPIRNWKSALNQFTIIFGDRMPTY